MMHADGWNDGNGVAGRAVRRTDARHVKRHPVKTNEQGNKSKGAKKEDPKFKEAITIANRNS